MRPGGADKGDPDFGPLHLAWPYSSNQAKPYGFFEISPAARSPRGRRIFSPISAVPGVYESITCSVLPTPSLARRALRPKEHEVRAAALQILATSLSFSNWARGSNYWQASREEPERRGARVDVVF